MTAAAPPPPRSVAVVEAARRQQALAAGRQATALNLIVLGEVMHILRPPVYALALRRHAFGRDPALMPTSSKVLACSGGRGHVGLEAVHLVSLLSVKAECTCFADLNPSAPSLTVSS